MTPKVPPFNLFDILQQNGRSENPKASRFYIFWHYATHQRLQKKFERKFGKTFFSICFRYFDIVRLLLVKKITAKVPPSFFLEYCGRMDVEKYQKVPLSVLSQICETFFNFFSPKGSPFKFY